MCRRDPDPDVPTDWDTIETMSRHKRLLRTLLLCVVLVIKLAPAFSDGPVTIAVILSRDITPYREALKGFEGELKLSDQKFRLIEFDAEAARGNPEALLEKIRGKRPTMVLTLGSAATELAARGIQDVPMVFSLVLPSSGTSSLDALRSDQGNLTGATMEIPVATQFAKIREILPEARRIGVLFDPAISGPLIESARKAAKVHEFELVTFPVSSESEVVERMSEMEGQVDVLWSVADSTVFTPQGLKHILLSTLRNRIPFVGLSPSFVKAGALLALSCDYRDIGRQSGEQALRILSGERAGDIPIVAPREVSLSLNMNTARQIRVAISERIEQAATETF